MVGHLGTDELAALAIAATLLAGTFTLFFLTYGTTAQVARYHGAGDERGREAGGAVAVAVGGHRSRADRAARGPGGSAGQLMGGDGRVGDLAVDYLRIGSLGLPFALIALAGQGYLRGVSDLRTPLVIVVVANAANVVLNVVFIYGLGWGLAGSAAATVVAQAGMGAAFVRALLVGAGRLAASVARQHAAAGAHRRRDLRPDDGAVRASFLVASAVLARVGDDSLGGAPDRLPAVRVPGAGARRGAIAGQVIVGRTLGAGDAEAARPRARRLIEWAVAAGALFGLVMLALTT